MIRLAGAAIILMVSLPLYRLVGIRGTGPAAEQTLRLGSLYLLGTWSGVLLAIGVAFVLSLLVGAERLSGAAVRGARMLRSSDPVQFGLLTGTVAAVISAWVSLDVLRGQPPLLDGVAQMIQARYFAGGNLTGPELVDPAFWQFQFMVSSGRGWTSQYPPGFALALAPLIGLGTPWVLGPLLAGLAVFLTSLLAPRLFPSELPGARLGVLLMAISPFLAFHAAAFMSHALALVLVLWAVWAALYSWEKSARWAGFPGFAVGALFLTRPYTAAYYGVAVAALTVWPWLRRSQGAALEGFRRLAVMATTALPLALLLGAYNRYVFGDPAIVGYLAAEGPGHNIGFHVDPWGSPYGPLEALGYTSADLASLSLDLLQGPIPVLVLIGAYMVTRARRSGGLVITLVLALLPVLAHFFYWHHDQFMGPRLLYESIPWWCLLLGTSAIGLVRSLPIRVSGPLGLLFAPRHGVALTLLGAVLVGIYAAPARLHSYSGTVLRPDEHAAPREVSRPALVFVHTSWQDRLAARLAGGGMRLDSVRAALRQNSSCALEQYLDGGSISGSGEASIIVEVAAGKDPRLREMRMPSGSVITVSDTEVMAPACEVQAQSDFDGVLALPPYVWQGDLPGLGSGGLMYVRDLGPRRNAALMRAFPEREALMLVRTREEDVRWLRYEEGVDRRWRSLPESSRRDGQGEVTPPA